MRQIILADERMSAQRAYRLICEGAALLWQGDFFAAVQLLQAIDRRIKKTKKVSKQDSSPSPSTDTPQELRLIFHRQRQAQAQRAHILGSLLVPIETDYTIKLRRAPNAQEACRQAWGETATNNTLPLRDLQGAIGAYEWRKKGVFIPALNGRIYPHYGVFSPVRGEYVDLVAQADLPPALSAQMDLPVWDIGTGSGVLSAVLARRGCQNIIAADISPAALCCAQENWQRLNLKSTIFRTLEADLFPNAEKAALIVCNPPWIPANTSSPLDSAIYDPQSRMLRGFLAGLAERLLPQGEGWLILSDLAQHLGLRSQEQLQAWIDEAGLQVLERHKTRPRHNKSSDISDPLHAARSAEITSLWRLGHKDA